MISTPLRICDGWTETETTTKEWEVSLEGTFNKGDTTGQKALLTALAEGTNLPLSLYIDKSASKADFSGNVKITSVDVETAVKDKIKLSIKAKGNGKLTGLSEEA